MLYDPDDKNKKNKGNDEGKLRHADEDNKRLTDDVKANENSLFGKEQEPRDDHGHDSLFDSSFDEDDLVSSSFAISFKANDPGSVSDILKDAPEIKPVTSYDYEDDLADFEFDSSVSAFKPLGGGNKPSHVNKPEPKPVNNKSKMELPKDPFEGIDDVPKPKFNDEDEDFLAIAGMASPNDEKVLRSGENIDYASSETGTSKSDFANKDGKVAEVKQSGKIDYADSSMDKKSSPFAHAKKPESPKPEVRQEPVKTVDPRDRKVLDSGKELDYAASAKDEPNSPFAHSGKPEAPKAKNIDMPSVKKIEEPDGTDVIQSYGKVVSGVNAFNKNKTPGKQEPVKPINPNDEKVLNAGKDLDYASSSADEAKSTFAHAGKPEAPKAKDIDMPSVKKIEEPEGTEVIQSYGKVESGVNAFSKRKTPGKQEPAKPIDPNDEKVLNAGKDLDYASSSADEAKSTFAHADKPEDPKPSDIDIPDIEEHKSEGAKQEEAASAALAAAAAAVSVKESAKPSSLPNTPNTRPAARPPVPEKPLTSDSESIIEKQALRPGSTDSTKARTAPKSSHSKNPSIEPVSQVNSKKKRKEPKSKKEPGKGGLITLLIVIVVFIGIFVLLDNADNIAKLFGKGDTVTTVDTSATTGTGTSESITSATESSAGTTESSAVQTTEPTTQSTTEATTESTTEATTEATTESTTEATTEATTESTTDATTPATGGVKVKLKASLINFKQTSSGFKFDVVLKNGSNKDASLSASLKNLKITLYSSNKIKNLTSDGFTFTHSGYTYTCKPIDRTIPAGTSAKITIKVTTSGKPAHFGYNRAKFNWM